MKNDTITRIPKVVMMSAFHLVLVKSQSNNFKLWWSQLSPQIHTDYTSTTSNYDGPSCLLIPLLTISSDPPSRQQPKQMDVHRRRPLFPTHHFFLLLFWLLQKEKCLRSYYIVILYFQLPPTLLSLLSSHNFNWVFVYSLVAHNTLRRKKQVGTTSPTVSLSRNFFVATRT